MQIALVAVVLLAGMWFTVLKPKPDTGSDAAPAAAAPAATPSASQPVAPGVKGLANAVDKAKGASAASDATNAKIQAATGGNGTAAASPSTAAKPAAAKATATPAAKAKAKAKAAAPTRATSAAKATTPAAAKPGAKDAAAVDPSERLLAYLAKGKTLVILFEGKGATDKAARKAVHLTAKADPKHVVSAYIPISEVGKYEAITSDVQVLTSPTVLVIGKDRKATPLTGFVDAAVIRQAVGDARRAAAAAK
jgi:hypothetical protein